MNLSICLRSNVSALRWFLVSIALAVQAACGGASAVQNSTPKTFSGLAPVEAADPDPIKFTHGVLCDDGERILKALDSSNTTVAAWGAGREIVTSLPVASEQGEFHLFLDDRDVLVGIITILRSGLALEPYPTIRKWLARTKKTGFIVESNIHASAEGIRHASYHLERREKSLHSVVTLSRSGTPFVYVDSRVLPGFGSILAANSKKFLHRIEGAGANALLTEREDFLALQQFASAEVARVGLCDDPNPRRAVERYRDSLEIGFHSEVYEAEAHHRAGLAYRDQEKFAQAIAAMQQSLRLRPAIAEVYHHLGTVYERMRDVDRAIEAYSTSVRLRPNYLIARFHLAVAYADVDPKRSIREFETYVALAEDKKREQDRLQRAKEYLIRLKGS